MISYIISEYLSVCALILTERKKQFLSALMFKALSSLIFVLCGYFRSVNHIGIFSPVFIGLCFGAIGDVLLNLCLVLKNNKQIFFVTGACSFLLGHIFYLVKLLSELKYIFFAVIIATVITGILIRNCYSKVRLGFKSKMIGLIYVVMIIFIASSGTVNMIFLPGKQNFLFGIGAILFMISDFILIIDKFIESKDVYKVCNLLFYYTGQLMIAFSIQ